MTFSDLRRSGAIVAHVDIGTIHTGLVVGGDLFGSVTAATGSIQGIDVTQGEMGAAIHAGTWIGGIGADYDMTGVIVAGGNIGQISSDSGDITGNIMSTGGSIAGVSAGLGDISSSSISAEQNIGDITAGDDLTSAITAAAGSIGNLSAESYEGGNITGSVHAGTSVGSLRAVGTQIVNTNDAPDADDSVVWFDDQSGTYIVNRIDGEPAPAGGGDITGNISAGTNIGPITALGKLSGNVIAAGSLGNIWALGDVSGNLNSNNTINVISWGKISGYIDAENNITAEAYDSITGDIYSDTGGLRAVSWQDISSNIDIEGTVTLWAAGSISGGSIDTDQINPDDNGGAVIKAWGWFGDSVTTARDINITSNVIENATFHTSAGSITLTAQSQISNVTAGSTVPDTAVGAENILCQGDVSGNFSGAGSGLTITGKDFQGTATAFSSILIQTQKDVQSGTIITSSGLGDVEVDGENVNATITAYTVKVAAYGAVNGSITAQSSADITADGPMNASVNVSGGSATIVASGAVNSMIVASGDISLTSLDAVAGQITSSTGGITVQALGNVSAALVAHGAVSVSGSADVSGSQESEDGSVTVFAEGNFTGELTAANDATVQTTGNVSNSASIKAGIIDGEYDGTYNATVVSYGNMAGTVDAANNVLVTSVGNISGTVTAHYGEADLSAVGADTGDATAHQRILVFADSISGNQFESDVAGVAITALHDISTNITAATAAAVEAGGNVTVTDVLTCEGANVTVAAVGNVNFTAADAPVAVINIFAGGNAQVTAGSSGSTGAQNPLSISVAAFGNIEGSLFSLSYVSASAWGTISQFTASTDASHSTIKLFAKGSISATINSADALFVSSLADVSGTFNADDPAGYVGTAEVDALGDISGTISGSSDTTVTAGGWVSGQVTSDGSAEVEAGNGISADVTATGGDATVYAIGGAVSGDVDTSVDADVFSGTDVSGAVTAYGDATVSSLGNIEGSVTATHGSAMVSADGNQNSDVTAGLDATVYAGTVGGDVSAGRNAMVVSGGVCSATVEAGEGEQGGQGEQGGTGDATVQALGNVSGDVMAAGNATVYSDGDVSAAVTATNGSATVLSGGNVSKAVSAGTSASVTAMGDVTGDVTAHTGATVLAIGGINADIRAGDEGSASVTSGDDIDGSITAGQGASVTSMGAISGSVTAGGSAAVTALGDESDSITAGTDASQPGGAIVFAWGDLSGSITTGKGDVSATAWGSDSAAINAAGNVTVQAFGAITGNVTAGGSVEVDGSLTITDSINAGGSAIVDGVGALDVSGHAGTGTSGGSFEVDGVANVNTNITASGDVTVSAGGNLSGSGESTAGDVSGTAGGNSTFNATADQGNATVVALGNLSGSITANQTATGDTFGQAGELTITGGEEADLSTLMGGEATVNSANGDVNVFSGGNVTINSEAYTDLQAGSNGSLTLIGTSHTGSVQAIAVGSLGGSIAATEGSVTAMSITTESAEITAGTDITLFGGTSLGGSANAGHDLQAVSYGDIGAAGGYSAGHDLWVYSTGNIGGVFDAGNSVRYFVSDGSIQANITAGSGTSTGEADYGIVGYDHVLTAWGNVSGTITAATSIAGIDAGGSVSAIFSAPTGSTGTITQHDSSLIGTKPLLGDVGQAALAALVRGLEAQGQELQDELSQQASAIQQQLSAEQEGAEQTYQTVTSEFSTAASQADTALATAKSAAQTVLDKAKADDQTRLTTAKNALTATIQQILTQASAAYQADSKSLTDCTKAVAQAQATLNKIQTDIPKVLNVLSKIQSDALGATRSKLAKGAAQWELNWRFYTREKIDAIANANNQLSQNHYLGLTADQWLLGAFAVGQQVAQKTLNAANGLTDIFRDLANLGISASAFISGTQITFRFSTSDWSNGLVVAETPFEHSFSKFVGGQALLALLTLGAGQALSGLSGAAEESELVELEEAAASGAEDAAGGASNLCTDGVNCFVAGTEVITGINTNGTFSETPIQNIKVGDTVLSRNQYDPNAPGEEEIVTAVTAETTYDLQQVTIQDADGTTETITSTPGHPFYVENQGFTLADDLTTGEELEEPDGSYATVISSITQSDLNGVTVYNFTVNNDHTYFVDQGGDAVWVHNTCRINALANDIASKGVHLNLKGVELRVVVQDGELVLQNLTRGASASKVANAVDEAEQFLAETENRQDLLQSVWRSLPHVQTVLSRNTAATVNQMLQIVELLAGE